MKQNSKKEISTTEKVYNALEQTTHKTEGFFEKHSKQIAIIFGTLLLIAIGYFLYTKFYVEPRNNDAMDDLTNVQKSINEEKYDEALKGKGNFSGLDNILKNYEGTDAANVAKFYAASANYQKKDYKKAIDLLEEFDSKDFILNAMKKGMLGDCQSQLKNYDKALTLYHEAVAIDDNEITAPLYLKKAGILALSLNKKTEALKDFTQIKEKYAQTLYGYDIDKYLAMAQ